MIVPVIAPVIALVMAGLWMWMAPVRALVKALVMAVPVNAGLWRAPSLVSIGFYCCCCYCWDMWMFLLLFFGPIEVLPRAADVWEWVLMGFDAVVIRSHVVLLIVV